MVGLLVILAANYVKKHGKDMGQLYWNRFCERSGKAGYFFSDVWGVGIPIIPCQSSVARMMILELRKRMSLIDATWMCCHSVDAVLGGAS